MLQLKTILHPTDFSENSHFALRMASALARDSGARLVIAHVNPPPAAMYTGEGIVPPVAGPDPEPIWKRLLQIQPEDANIKVEHVLYEGDEVGEILRAAEASNADLIVMGTHGRTGIRRLLMGSVAEQILRKAPCPVLTVKPPAEATG